MCATSAERLASSFAPAPSWVYLVNSESYMRTSVTSNSRWPTWAIRHVNSFLKRDGTQMSQIQASALIIVKPLSRQSSRSTWPRSARVNAVEDLQRTNLQFCRVIHTACIRSLYGQRSFRIHAAIMHPFAFVSDAKRSHQTARASMSNTHKMHQKISQMANDCPKRSVCVEMTKSVSVKPSSTCVMNGSHDSLPASGSRRPRRWCASNFQRDAFAFKTFKIPKYSTESTTRFKQRSECVTW